MSNDHVIHDESSSGAVGSNQYIDAVQDSDPLADKVDLLDKMELYEALIYEHPDYVANYEKWKKYEDCYEAEDIYRFIFQHPRESENMFATRLKRGYYYNYCASVVDLIVAYLFHSPIERLAGDTLDSDMDEIYKDADLAGSTYVNFMQDVAAFSQIHGHCGVLVDAPKAEGLESEADRKDQGIRPYLTRVKATQIKDWSLDRFGKFEWVKIEVNRSEDRDIFHPTSGSVRHFLVWDREQWTEYEVNDDEQEARLLDQGDHNLRCVPLVVFYNEKAKNHRWFGSSMLRDIADVNIALLNWSSLGDEEIAERCLNVLVMESGGGDSAEILSHHNILEYTPGSKPPEYLVPGDTPLKLIGEWIDRAKDEIFRLSKLSGSTGLLGVREATSGIAYAYEFNETNQSLAKKAEGMEQGEIEVHRMVAKWLSKDWEGTVAYPREFGVDDFLSELQLLAESRGNLSSETAIKELEKKILAKMFAREPMELRSKIKGEVEKSDPKSVGFAENFDTVPPGMTEGPAASTGQSPEPGAGTTGESGSDS